MVRVLVTRPGPAAAKTAARLKEMGFEPVLLPLFKTVFHPLPTPMCSGEFGAVAVTSRNAVAAVETDFAGKALPLYAVGKSTADAARQAGFQNIRVGTATGRELAAKIVTEFESNQIEISVEKPLLYLAGKERRPEFERMLERAGIPLEVAVVYQMNKISYPTDLLNMNIFLPFPDAVLLYSVNAARRFAELISQEEGALAGNQVKMVCLSGEVAQSLPQALRALSVIAGAPTQDALLETLAAIR